MKKILAKLFGATGSNIAEKISNIIDKHTFSKIEKAEFEKEMTQIWINAESDIQKNVSDRWKNDMNSDSWLSKNVRPLVLLFLVLSTVLIVFIDAGVITTRSSGNNLIIRASGTGAVVVDNMRFSSSTLTTTSGDLVIEPGDEDVGISAAGALNVPHGTEAQRPSTYRDVRYNTTTNFFELFSNAYTPLKGIWSEDRQTYVLADNSNRFDFYTNGVTNVNMGVDGLTAHRLVSQDSITIDNGTISSAGTNDAINLTANGTGSVITANFKFKDNTITNTHATNNLVLSKTGIYGYIQFDGTYGIKIPYGSTASRPLGYVGATRFNTTLNYLETYDGDSASWANVSGAGDSINTEYMEELGFIYTLALG